MTTSGRRRVLQSVPAAGADTRYATHMAAVDSADFEVVFFTWREALTGRFDIFHLHWPEQLLGRDRGPGGWMRWLRLRALLARLERRNIPVVYTLHNHRPHDRVVASRLGRASVAFAALTRVQIHLVPEPENVREHGDDGGIAVIDIPHGHYRAPFAPYPMSSSVPGRLVTFGILKKYKGIARLLDVFASVDDSDLSLRIIGEPADPTTVTSIEAAVSADPRVTRQYGFVPDGQLVREVSQARLVVLPYTEMHSSGAVLVALSLDRPVLVPDSPTTRALRDEVGRQWVHVYSPPLTAEAVRAALAVELPAGRPDLDARAWDRVRDGHVAAYRRALSGASRGPRSSSASRIRATISAWSRTRFSRFRRVSEEERRSPDSATRPVTRTQFPRPSAW